MKKAKLQSIITSIFKKKSRQEQEAIETTRPGFTSLGHLKTPHYADAADPVNALELKVAYIPEKNQYICFNYRFNDDVGQRQDWAVAALRNEGSRFHCVENYIHTHNYVESDEGLNFEPINDPDLWARLKEEYNIDENHVYDVYRPDEKSPFLAYD